MGSSGARILSVIVGLATFGAAGWMLGEAWWAAAGVGAAAVVAAQFDHRMSHLLVVATLAVTVGAAGSDHQWLVVAVTAGVIASVELAAGADRVTIVGPAVPDLGRVGWATVAAAALASVVVVVGDIEWSRGDWAAVVAAGAAVVSLRLLAR